MKQTQTSEPNHSNNNGHYRSETMKDFNEEE